MPKLKEESRKASNLHNKLQLTKSAERGESDELSIDDQWTFFGHRKIRF